MCVCMLSPNMCDLHAYANYIIMRNSTTTSASATEIDAKTTYAARVLEFVTCQSIRNLEGSAFIPPLVVHSPRCSSQMSRTSSPHHNTPRHNTRLNQFKLDLKQASQVYSSPTIIPNLPMVIWPFNKAPPQISSTGVLGSNSLTKLANDHMAVDQSTASSVFHWRFDRQVSWCTRLQHQPS